MHSLNMPAGTPVRLTATALAHATIHRWTVQVHDKGGVAAEAPALLTYASYIGGEDCDQRVDIPAQKMDCDITVSAQQSILGDQWQYDRLTIFEDTTSRLEIGFCNPSWPATQASDLVLSFAFPAARTEN